MMPSRAALPTFLATALAGTALLAGGDATVHLHNATGAPVRVQHELTGEFREEFLRSRRVQGRFVVYDDADDTRAFYAGNTVVEPGSCLKVRKVFQEPGEVRIGFRVMSEDNRVVREFLYLGVCSKARPGGPGTHPDESGLVASGWIMPLDRAARAGTWRLDLPWTGAPGAGRCACKDPVDHLVLGPILAPAGAETKAEGGSAARTEGAGGTTPPGGAEAKVDAGDGKGAAGS